MSTIKRIRQRRFRAMPGDLQKQLRGDRSVDVRFRYKDPSGNVATLVYGTDAALVKDSDR
jgi:hypothetical protein